MSLGRQQLFVKDVAPNDVVPESLGRVSGCEVGSGSRLPERLQVRVRGGRRAGDGVGPGVSSVSGRWLQWKNGSHEPGSHGAPREAWPSAPLAKKPALPTLVPACSPEINVPAPFL